MIRGITLLFGGLVWALLVTAGPGLPDGDRLLALYRHADSLYHLERSTPVTDSIALAGFSAVADELEKGKNGTGNDTLLIGALLKKGILLDAGGDFARARSAYCRVLAYHPANDSLVFVTQVLVGTAYYNLDHFDSASFFLLRAEALAGRFTDRDNSVRLYNTLGALYCDNGNYRQGKNYFDHALELERGGKTYDTAAAVSLQINIATASFRVGQYADALAIYRQLLSYRPLTNYVFLNIGRTYSAMENYAAALDWFRRVKGQQLPGVWNEMANAELQLHRLDSCAFYLRRMQEFTRHDAAGRVHPLDLGNNALYRAGELAERGDLPKALASLQQAIIGFARNFNDPDIYANPVNFTGAFAYYRLFDALVTKAELFSRLYDGGKQEKDLAASYAAYTEALSLLRYIEKSYATDEAKLFLKKKSGPAHVEALAVCLRLNKLHPGGDYLGQAFLIGERSKASVITANLEEKAFMGAPGAGQKLLQEVNNRKYHIARLNVKSEGTSDPVQLAAINREKGGDEIELLRLQKELEKDGEYYRVKYGDAAPGMRDLQHQLGGDQALVSLFAAGGVLHVFVVTREGFSHTAVDSLAGLQRDVEGWLTALKTTGNGRRFAAGAIGRRLYTALVQPIQAAAKGKSEWVIIPDGIFGLLPFESLYADAEGRQWLVETTTISYRFSSRLLNNGDAVTTGDGVLAFAPFGSAGVAPFERLPASREEITGLPGSQWFDGRATKQEFLANIDHYPIVHLATHAVSSMDDAAASFIAFYPERRAGRSVAGDSADYRLYLEELYGMNLRQTRLVIISACETGQGEVVPQEGVISLARAFAYAGCGSTINSLWKADDQATSAILRQFYVYLRRGESKARALQLAKLDYLKSDAIDKSPAYWAHLILTGDSAALYPDRHWVWWVMGLGLLGVGVLVLALMSVWKKRKKKSRRL